MKEKFKRGGKNQKSGRKTKEREEELNKPPNSTPLSNLGYNYN